MNHLELFAGIGGFRRALDLLSEDQIIDFKCVGFSEIDPSATKTYKTIYKISDDEVEMGDIVEFTSKLENIKSLPHFDLLTGGFPCQTFSMMGKQAGFNEDRGQMFFRILDIVKEIMPKYLLLENVKNLYSHDKGNTFKRIRHELETLGYNVAWGIFNTSDYYLPQTRNRVLIFASLEAFPEGFIENFTPENVKALFLKNIHKCSVYKYENTLDILDKAVPEKYFLSERIKPTILADGSANFKSNSEINLRIARPLTASMHKMHRACQDNYYSQDFIESNGKVNPVATCSKNELATRRIRRITPEEAFALQGFPKDFATKARAAGVSDGALYKQAGNAVSVNTIYAIMFYLIKNKAIK